MIELHRHVDGSIPPKFMWGRLRKHGLAPCNTYKDFKKLVYAEEGETLLDYLDRFHIPMWVTQFYGNVKDAIVEIVTDAKLEGIDTLELRWSPIIHTYAGMTVRQSIRCVLDGMNRALTLYPHMKLGLIIIAMKQHGPHIAKILARAALSESQHLHSGCGVVGFDLAGAERGFPPKIFKEAFELARKGGLKLTCHAGEAGPPEYIWQTLDDLGVDRIGHGCSAVKDKELLKRMARDKVLVECCITSNYQTGAWVGPRHPIVDFIENEIPIAICADNPVISCTDLPTEIDKATKMIGGHLGIYKDAARNLLGTNIKNYVFINKG